jgi:5-methylthioribose kinase
LPSIDVELSVTTPGPLTELARAQAWIEPTDQITKLAVAGDGNMNRVLRGYLASGDTRIFKQSLPYVAKYPEIPAPIERVEVEAAFYATIAAASRLAAATPNVLGYDRSNHLLCMQDLGDAHDFTYLYKTQTADQVGQSLGTLLGWLSELHSLQLTSTAASRFANLPMRKLNHAHIFEIPFTANNGVSLSETMAEAATELRHDPTLSNKRAHLGQIYLGQSGPASTTCLLHGDFYPASWMINTLDQIFVIDPEFAFYGPAEFDVGVLLAHLTLTGGTQHTLNHCLEHYQPPAGFAVALAWQFAGIEVMRRLLGVAQLPLATDEPTKLAWLEQAHTWL